MSEDASELFIKHLQEEKLKTQAARMTYVTRKLAYATGFLGLGSLKIGSWDLSPILYLVPFLALAFDLYILGEDYSVKRIGAFLRSESVADLEQRWEDWVSRNRDPFARYALPLLTNVLATASALVLWSRPGDLDLRVFIPWMLFAVLPIWGLFFYYKKLCKKAIESTAGQKSVMEPIHPLLKFRVWKLRGGVKKEDYTLTEKLYKEVKLLTPHRDKLRPSDKEEPLVVVDRDGNPMKNADGNWFQVPRWLCHLLRLRHRCAHALLIWPSPELGDMYLLQIRDWNKDDWPGRFDISVGGHVQGFDTPEETVYAEMNEEFNLMRSDLESGKLKQVACYEYNVPVRQQENFYNTEWRVVYVGRLLPDSLKRIRFKDKEVAGFTLIPASGAQALLAQQVIPMASALRESLPKCF
jgi:isopentenyldiphosphate isomerase